jgi:bacteriorhodopsin
MPGNEAIAVNDAVGPQADLAINNRGSDWYYTVCAIMGATTVAIMALSFRKPQTHRIFHYITAGITAVATVAYFSMGSNLGQTPIQAEFVRPFNSQVSAAGTREIFYARYIDWVITTPLLLLDLLLTAGVPLGTILVALLADEIMIVCGLVGALTRSSYKWGFWTFGMAAFFFVVYALLFDGRRHASALGGEPKKTYMMCGVWLIFLWFLYPIAWGLSEGGNVIHPDAEAIFYGILDIMAKPVFGALLLWGHRNIAPADIGLYSRHGDHMGEKYGAARNGVQPEGPGTNIGGAGSNVTGAGHPATTGEL